VLLSLLGFLTKILAKIEQSFSRASQKSWESPSTLRKKFGALGHHPTPIVLGDPLPTKGKSGCCGPEEALYTDTRRMGRTRSRVAGGGHWPHSLTESVLILVGAGAISK